MQHINKIKVKENGVRRRVLLYEHNARSGGTPAAPRENDLVWRLVVLAGYGLVRSSCGLV